MAQSAALTRKATSPIGMDFQWRDENGCDSLASAIIGTQLGGCPFRPTRGREVCSETVNTRPD